MKEFTNEVSDIKSESLTKDFLDLTTHSLDITHDSNATTKVLNQASALNFSKTLYQMKEPTPNKEH